jgi:hypothetical protein
MTYRLLATALAGWPAYAAGGARHRGSGHGPDGSTKAAAAMGQTGRPRHAPRTAVAEKARGLGPVPTGEGRSRPADEWAALSAGGVVAPVDGRATAVFLREKMKRRVEYDVNRPRVS